MYREFLRPLFFKTHFLIKNLQKFKGSSKILKKIIKMNKEIKTFAEIIKLLKAKKVVACPTDTVFGLLANAANPKAVNKVFRIKQRKPQNALPIFVYSMEQAKKIAYISKQQEKLLKKFWPGKITAVLKLKPNKLPKKYFKSTIALRIPKHKLVLKILKSFKKPLIGTSANISGKKTCLSSKCVEKQFKNKKNQPNLIISGKLKPSKPSTIIDLTKTPTQILRKGAEYQRVKATIPVIHRGIEKKRGGDRFKLKA